MLWHMLLFGDAFGPAYANFLCVLCMRVRVCAVFFVFFFLIFNFELYACLFRKNLNASKPSNYQSKGLGGNIGCRDKNSTWY